MDRALCLVLLNAQLATPGALGPYFLLLCFWFVSKTYVGWRIGGFPFGGYGVSSSSGTAFLAGVIAALRGVPFIGGLITTPPQPVVDLLFFGSLHSDHFIKVLKGKWY